MVLVDTSVWVRALAGRSPFVRGLAELLERDEVLAHDLIEGELLIGDRGGRKAVLASYRRLSRAPTLPHAEVVAFIESRRLHGRGIGWIDAHLLGSSLVAGVRLWTGDASLAEIAGALRLGYTVPPA